MLEEAVLIGLAAWRLASFLVNEDGPFNIFARIRSIFGVKEGPVEGFFPMLLSCMFCMTVWTSVTCYFIWQLEPIIIVVLSAMAFALIVEKRFSE